MDNLNKIFIQSLDKFLRFESSSWDHIYSLPINSRLYLLVLEPLDNNKKAQVIKVTRKGKKLDNEDNIELYIVDAMYRTNRDLHRWTLTVEKQLYGDKYLAFDKITMRGVRELLDTRSKSIRLDPKNFADSVGGIPIRN